MIETMLVVSTAHVTLNDNTLFTESKSMDGIPIFTKYDGGWMFYGGLERKELLDGLKEAGVSMYATRLIEYAFITLKVRYLMIDMDGDTLPEFPIFDW